MEPKKKYVIDSENIAAPAKRRGFIRFPSTFRDLNDRFSTITLVFTTEWYIFR